ncbi:MAG: preprotein translocase subunit SecE [Candidatus Falkowbacteria bacterium]
MSKFTQYIKDSVAEMKKVTWPTKKQTYHYAILVIGISIGTAAFLGALDWAFTLGLKMLIK